MKCSKKVFVVSGGASGLGRACVDRLVREGANIVVADLNRKLGDEVALVHGEATLFVEANISDESEVENIFSQAIEHFGCVDGVINCAGVGFPEKTISKDGLPHQLKGFRKTIEVNLIGSFNMARIGAQFMAKNSPVENERGVIIFTASVAAFEGQIGQVAYSASKGGIVGMTLPMARDLASVGIRVMTIAPGIFDTPMLAGLDDKIRTALGQM